MDVSISEITSYLRCRRAWHFQSPNRRGLHKIGAPSAPLYLGTAVHEALAANAAGGSAGSALAAWRAEEVASFRRRYEAAVGYAPSPLELEPIEEAYRRADGLVSRYLARYGEATPLGPDYRYVAVEQTFRVPIPGTDGHLIGTLDGLARHAGGDLYYVEHKTFSRKPNHDTLVMSPQFTAYAWAARALFGDTVRGLLYDGLSSKLPVAPALLKSGKLSEAWVETVDHPTYLAAIHFHGLDPDDYAGILLRLAERDARDQTPFYTRWKIAVAPAQIGSFAGYLPAIYREMAGDPAIFPNFAWQGCRDCQVVDLCHATQFGEDVDWLVGERYTTGAGSASFRGRDGQEVAVDETAFA